MGNGIKHSHRNTGKPDTVPRSATFKSGKGSGVGKHHTFSGKSKKKS